MKSILYYKLKWGMNNRLEDLVYEGEFSINEIMIEYKSRLSNIKKCYGDLYKGRESHMLVKAYRGTQMYVKAGRSKDKKYI